MTMGAGEFIERFGREKASAILRTDDQDRARRAMDAAVRAGFRVCEFTLTTPGAFELIAEFAKKEGIVVGAGTVLTVEDARRAVDAGARFLVSPVVDEAVISEAGEMDVAVMPGANTPTEMLRAHRAGAGLQKLFPAPSGGPLWVKSVLGPLPFLKIVPTNGVDASNAQAFLEAGAHALGFVGTLFDAKDLAMGDWGAIEARGRAILSALRRADGGAAR